MRSPSHTAAVAFGLCALLASARLAGAVCATVQLDIPQSVALERQAFEAILTLRNGLMHLNLEAVSLSLRIREPSGQDVPWTADPDGTGAVFFVHAEPVSGVGALDGGATVPAGAAVDARWILIPAPGAGGSRPEGVCYEVGGRLSYVLAGIRYDHDLVPDVITVFPMPDLRVDLFMPEWVAADDPRTPTAEPCVPFPVGLRVLNLGAGTAARVAVALGTPRIVDNETGLRVNFTLGGCDVDGRSQATSLQAEAGDLAPLYARVVRWWMTCSLAGTFVDVDVATTHADELGGRVTALIRDENTVAHRLRKDVLVDLPGRDARPDFLSVAGGLYESDGVDGVCADLSASAGLDVDGDVVTVRLTSTGGFVYAGVRLPPDRWAAGTVRVRSAVRSDGLRLSAENAWVDMRLNDTRQWEAWLCVFDHPAGGDVEYRCEVGAASANQAPRFVPVPDVRSIAGREVVLRVDAFDPDGTRPMIGASPLPAGAVFVADGVDGGWLRWTPVAGQAGTYSLEFTVTDGLLTTSLRVPLAVTPADAKPGSMFFFR